MNTSNLQMNNIALYHFRVSILINGALIIIWFGCGGLNFYNGKEKLQRHQETIQDIISFITRQIKINSITLKQYQYTETICWKAVIPLYPSWHTHTKPPFELRHVAPFRQGELWQWSILTWQSVPCQPGSKKLTRVWYSRARL